MKTLDAFALINGIDQTLNTLKQQSQQISSIEKQIQQIISLDGALKGEAGQAIRSFYTECHIPFLQFFQVVIEEYSSALKQTKQALHTLESNQHGFISQAFIEHELDQGLKKAERAISDIVSNVSQAIGRVSHIVHLPHVDESAFQQSYQKAWLETSRTIGLLHAFDREQTSAMNETTSALQTMKQYINTLSTMFTGPKIEITSYQKGSIFKNGKEEKISSTISGLNDKIDNPKDNPMMIMLKKLREKQQANVETVVRDESHKNINQQVTANDPSLTTWQREAVNGKNKIHRDIRVINDKLYNVKGIKKLKEFDIADEVVTDSSDIDFIGGRYTVYANKQIIRTYIANGEVKIEEVDKIPESRSRGNAKRILDGEVVSTTENIILEYSGIYDGYRAVTGKDPETSKNISSTEQALSAASIIPIAKIGKIGKYVFKIDQGKSAVKRITTSTGSKIDSDTIKKYVRDIEGRTGRELPKNQIDNLKAALRNKEYSKMSPIETAKHRAKFDSVKNKVIKEWERNTGQKWPVYNENIISGKTGKVIRKKGDKYDAHHIIENTFGGEHEWWNMHPAKFPNEHQAGIHGAGSPANTLFKGVKK
ncbi:T7SS effector LXG polymorphic toxin [Bacillus altitudinis]|uniref:T7SS effector LXG polymorphic toxin n=1 Tax=Bacillus altitudinis TaxID=293387 RepID=UPI001B33B687|nr:T7SS effector LXG polymorphic toxin [Bacillus altitudinis]MCY7497550.1 T7SS effector LXG polymorphic toxin [Bacillus altitudinis]MCY7534866.1 T7SS effector LXG polymorphic toxin [Bacillus altitudinis]MCY7545820.1 T7SS effector LXG polymorphic toxin [Bacillus altitudinis]MCY7556469.1 T7SS effector LXG polymorphic toxin [Bacillus altitudinis]MCY7591372.1 T7SS effector LXG polymorphic toxin [Bacillus altitudinis]